MTLMALMALMALKALVALTALQALMELITLRAEVLLELQFLQEEKPTGKQKVPRITHLIHLFSDSGSQLYLQASSAS